MRSMCVGVAETGRFRALRSATTAVGGRHRLLKKVHENYNAKREEREFVKSRFRSCP